MADNALTACRCCSSVIGTVTGSVRDRRNVPRVESSSLSLLHGLSEPARHTYAEGTCFMTMTGSDLFGILEGRIPLDDVLRRKKRHANDTGSCHFPVNEML